MIGTGADTIPVKPGAVEARVRATLLQIELFFKKSSTKFRKTLLLPGEFKFETRFESFEILINHQIFQFVLDFRLKLTNLGQNNDFFHFRLEL